MTIQSLLRVTRRLAPSAAFAVLFVGDTGDSLAQQCGGDAACVVLHQDAGSEPATNGSELVFRINGPGIVSNLRGSIAAGVQPDINANGEIVYSGFDSSTGTNQIFSTTRGRLTAVPDPGAFRPAINGLGEVLYTARDAGNHDAIFSTTRGQLTFFTGAGMTFPDGFDDGPTIDDSGRVVIVGIGPANALNL